MNSHRPARNILGVICYQGHASAAALIRDGTPTDAVSEDRFTRRKQDTGFPVCAIRHILDRNGLRIEDISEVGFAWSPGRSLLGQIRQMLRIGPAPWPYFFSQRAHHSGLSRVDKFMRMWGAGSDFMRHFGHRPRLAFVPHHLAHSFSACMMIPDKTNLLSVVADGTGEESAISCYQVVNGRHQRAVETPFPHSFGILYSAITQLLGFIPDLDEYKVMGLSSYGGLDPSPQVKSAMAALAVVTGARLRLNLGYFRLHRSASRFYDDSLAALLGARGKSAILEDPARIAFGVQELLERRMGELIEQAAARLPLRPDTLCTSGGVFLNCLLNQRLRQRFHGAAAPVRFDHFHFSPIADDNGTALGAAAYLHHRRSGCWPEPYRYLNLGPEYSEAQMLAAVQGHPGLAWRRAEDPAPELAQRIAQGRVAAFYQGRTEYGPRALGFRSILADPRRADIKEILNKKIKLREPFCPFAPSVLAEKAADFFILADGQRFPYMIETVQVRPERARLIPGVVHVDGTSRIQTVSRAENPAYHALISEFDRLTGIPLLLNTSLNLHTQPIVNSPEDAIRCFLDSGIDDLALGPFLIEK